ncbi:unnamed protein product [Medioppia subpectinata]|uniref:G-protein coupled receptors family 3 profile domain-containing protein n=1 Tax=Medioppia subpectinata TaxID=1979941 RepID=A0A7R9KPI2_9ACAR|nr:unnamed protein product [Medioppia subpectinata]CAG2107392.1 unnamed protein product [Medioppia subpectinata]
MVYRQISLAKHVTVLEVVMAFKEELFVDRLLWVIPVFTWCISIAVAERMVIWRMKLEHDQSGETIYRIRQAYVEVRAAISHLDQSLKLIYVIITSQNIKEYNRFNEMMVFVVIGCIVKLNADCLINGFVYQESEKLLSVLDSLDIMNAKYSEQDFREVLLFKSLVTTPVTIGFTIGGSVVFLNGIRPAIVNPHFTSDRIDTNSTVSVTDRLSDIPVSIESMARNSRSDSSYTRPWMRQLPPLSKSLIVSLILIYSILILAIVCSRLSLSNTTRISFNRPLMAIDNDHVVTGTTIMAGIRNRQSGTTFNKRTILNCVPLNAWYATNKYVIQCNFSIGNGQLHGKSVPYREGSSKGVPNGEAILQAIDRMSRGYECSANGKQIVLNEETLVGVEKEAMLSLWFISYTALILEKSEQNTINDNLDSTAVEKSIRGIISADIDITGADINQCDSRHEYYDHNYNSVVLTLSGTHKCHHQTSQCIFTRGVGWLRGGYKCRCRNGYHSAVANLGPMFNGSVVEQAFEDKSNGKNPSYDYMFFCKRCADGCDVCQNDSPCLSSYNWAFRISLLTITLLCIIFTVVLGTYIYRFRKLKVIKVASPVFLCITLLGCSIMYSETAAIFPVLDVWTCVLTKWTRHLGFCVTYSALLLKTWRVSLTYRVKSAHKLKLTDKQLLQWLFPILLVMAIYLSTWTISAPPEAIYLIDWNGLKFKQCDYNWWDHSLAIVILPNAGPDIKYFFGFIRTQMSTTTTVILIFGPKFYRVIKGEGDLWDNRVRARGVTASFSLNGVGLVHEETTDLYQENEELKEEIQKLASQVEIMKICQMEFKNRHLPKPKYGTQSHNNSNIINISTNPISGSQTNSQSPIVKAIYSKFETNDPNSQRISPNAELISEKV